MIVLGISGGTLAGNQDPAAALFRDGALVAAVEEERLLGVKHANGRLPRRAIAWCLASQGLSIEDVDAVASPGRTYRAFDRILRDFFELHFGHAPPIHLVDHHRAHAASVHLPSDLERSRVLTLDFSGDGASTVLFEAEGVELSERLRLAKPDSLGLFYGMLTQYLGFEKDDEEYKVMGLASYGEPRHDLSGVLRISGDAFEVDPDRVKLADTGGPAPSKQEALFRDLPLPEPHRLPGAPITRYHMDVAASAQRALEQVVLHVVERAGRAGGPRDLCLAGGVALNCVLNQRIRESGLVDRLLVPPHASDAGLAVGAAALHGVEASGRRPPVMTHAFWGPAYGAEELEAMLRTAGVAHERPDDLEARAADALASGRFVGWFQGRMELGPRALGARSILADPRGADVKDRLNATVKRREPFRPFAPSVLVEEAGAWFDRAVPSPFMTATFDVRPERRGEVPAITHVDGTARIQTVDPETAPRFHRLIASFAERTGVPLLLNTSLNVRGRPIVSDPRDAIGLLHATGLHALALGPFWIEK